MDAATITAIAGLVTMIGGYAVGGITIQQGLENLVMGKVKSPELKFLITLGAGIFSNFIFELTQGTPWQQAASDSISKGLVLAGAAIGIHKLVPGVQADSSVSPAK
jgi:hypothetical protein